MNILSEHGELRLKERLGVPYRASRRQFVKAMAEGKRWHEIPQGAFQRFVRVHSFLGQPCEAVAHNGILYLVGRSNGNLITAFKVPKIFRKYAAGAGDDSGRKKQKRRTVDGDDD